MYKVTIELNPKEFRRFVMLLRSSGGDAHRIVQASEVAHLLSAAVGMQDDEDMDEVKQVDFNHA